MNKILYLISFFIFLGCGNKNEIPKPSKPIDKKVMEEILYDLALLQALKSFNPKKLSENNIDPKSYIYQKYAIDSLQFVENNKYFTSDAEAYKIMYENVSNRIKKEKEDLDKLLKKEADSLKKIKDSVVKTDKKAILKKDKDFFKKKVDSIKNVSEKYLKKKLSENQIKKD